MSKRSSPIPSETAFHIDAKDQHLSDIKYTPIFIDHITNYFSGTGRGKAANLYSFLSTVYQRSKRRHLHYPWWRIKKDLNWSKPTILKYMEVLAEFGLIDGFRLDNNGMKSETRVDFIPYHLIDLQRIYNVISDEKFGCNCRKYALHYLGQQLKKFTVVENRRKPTNERRSKNFTLPNNRRSKNFTLNMLSRDNILSISSRDGINPSPGDKKTSYSSIESVPKKFLKQIKLLRRRLHKEFPTRYRTVRMNNKEIIDQANKLRICQDKDKYDWDTILKPALDWAMDDPFWIQNLRSYSSLKSKWKNGDTKIQNLIVQWEKTAPSKPTAKAKPIESYYSEAHLKKQARKTVDQLDVQDHQIKTLVDNIKGIEVYYESIPKQFKKYSFFYQNHWAMITRYIWWLKEEVHFDNLSPKLIWTGNSMFKKFLEWSKNDTTIRLSIRDGKYA